MIFTTEAAFEEALIKALSSQKGWENTVLRYPTEEQLLANWADILFQNNRGIDRLNDQPLIDSEMQQIVEQITQLRTPLKLNGFINGKTVSITRDNPADELHFGKEVSLKIYDRHEIAAGQSRYQIAQQPQFKSKLPMLRNRRGDLVLLINGMPVIFVELKKSGVPVSYAYNQIEKYSRESLFTGLFSLVQVVVAMAPDETRYFANPGPDGRFNKDFYFHWANFNNDPINYWEEVASRLLSIPMAHQLIGFYTVPDDTDGVLKVMRSYQYYAANAISDKVAKTDFKSPDAKGGYIWHTTGSGKTMTSFKSAQLIANSKDADKVVFLMDRIELGTQSLKEYQGFSDAGDDVQGTEDTSALKGKLKSSDPAHTLIVTSIQKMSRIKDEEGGMNSHDIELMNSKRIVFIVDEAHRSTFGDMLIYIKRTFSSAIFFGFTGTPILDENQKKDSTTSTVFGNELHRYSIADGIRDKNVLGFNPYKVLTHRDRDLRMAIALEKARADDVAEAMSDPAKRAIYNRYMNEVPMAGYMGDNGGWVSGIEDLLPASQFNRDEHKQKVVEDILENWDTFSQASKFHAIFATERIADAIKYYRLFKQQQPKLKVTALFDSHFDETGGVVYKEDGLIEIMEDYNEQFEQDYRLANHAKFKKDIANRLSHKKPYLRIEHEPEKQIDLLIVVNQMLTGFDSKWINTLYLDKVIEYENIIQAFSRTNRLFGPDKPFGTVRYYRYPHTMEQNIKAAIKLYSGDKPLGLFVERLDHNLNGMNQRFDEIADLFQTAGIENFERLPEDLAVCGRFATLFREFNRYLEAARVQGFKWDSQKQVVKQEDGDVEIEMHLDEQTYLTLVQRYKELFDGGGDGGGIEDVPYEIDTYITEIETGAIDAAYMNSRFEKYLKTLRAEGVDEEQLQQSLDELHKSFASLTQEEQKYSNIFLHDVQSGEIQIETGKTFRDYITEYQYNAKNEQIHTIANILGLDEEKLRSMMDSGRTAANINEYGRFDELKDTVDQAKSRAYFEELEGTSISAFNVNRKVYELLQDFIINGGFKLPKT